MMLEVCSIMQSVAVFLIDDLAFACIQVSTRFPVPRVRVMDGRPVLSNGCYDRLYRIPYSSHPRVHSYWVLNACFNVAL